MADFAKVNLNAVEASTVKRGTPQPPERNIEARVTGEGGISMAYPKEGGGQTIYQIEKDLSLSQGQKDLKNPSALYNDLQKVMSDEGFRKYAKEQGQLESVKNMQTRMMEAYLGVNSQKPAVQKPAATTRSASKPL